jgi:hypothetical protein
MIVAVIIASIILRTPLRAMVLMLAGAVVVMNTALIGRRGLNHRTGAEHQYAETGDQTIRDFHVASS